jgi:hypothetical protein
MKKNHAIIAYITLGLALFLTLSLFFFVAIDANPPIVVNDIDVTPHDAVRGGSVLIMVDFCKRTAAESSLTAYWQREEDGLVWDLTRSSWNISPYGCNKIIREAYIPDDLPDGEWKRVNIATYKVNFIASRTVEWQTEYITVK